jgi:hypothetical protein
MKFVPVSVRRAPPESDPDVGVIDVTLSGSNKSTISILDGSRMYWNDAPDALKSAPLKDTSTAAVRSDSLGEVHVRRVADTNTHGVVQATAPKRQDTVGAEKKLTPVRVTGVAAETKPREGVTALTAGVAAE